MTSVRVASMNPSYGAALVVLSHCRVVAKVIDVLGERVSGAVRNAHPRTAEGHPPRQQQDDRSEGGLHEGRDTAQLRVKLKSRQFRHLVPDDMPLESIFYLYIEYTIEMDSLKFFTQYFCVLH